MSDNSKIEWTDATLNALVGCTKISPGCRNCSALRDAHRLSHNPNPKIAAKYKGTVTADGKNWTGKINYSEETLLLPLQWATPRRIFTNYTSDLFHLNMPDEWRDRHFAVMALANQHTYQPLTKRADLALAYLGYPDRRLHVLDALCRFVTEHEEVPAIKRLWRRMNEEKKLWGVFTETWPLPNVWVGFSAEDQERFDERWPFMRQLATEGWTIFVSCEPLLSAIRLPADFLALGNKAQVIAGGESGNRGRVRHSHPDWFRALRDQCHAAGVAFLFKQWGEHLPLDQAAAAGVQLNVVDANTLESGFIAVGKKRAGRVLDGRVWDEYPAGFSR